MSMFKGMTIILLAATATILFYYGARNKTHYMPSNDLYQRYILPYPLDESQVHRHPPTDESHVDGHSFCLESVEKCLDHIINKSRRHPKLVSHSKQQPIYNLHPVTGEQLIVPNIVHIVRFGQSYSFEFQHYVSLKSIDKFIKPHLLLIWGDYLPLNTSVWWMRTLQEVANIYFVPTDRIPIISGKPVKFPAHEADWLRMVVIRG